MPDAFFASKSKKRERAGGTSSYPHKGKKGAAPKKRRKDEDLDSQGTGPSGDEGFFDDVELRASDVDPAESGDEYADETPAEKRLRLAKLYLESVKKDLGDGEYDAAEIDKELIEARLQKDVLEHAGKVHLYIAESVGSNISSAHKLRLRGHRLSVTKAVASEDGSFLYSSGKEGSIIKWDLGTGSRQTTFPKLARKDKGKQKAHDTQEGHTDEVLTLALSTDMKYLASGGKDRKVVVWDVQTGKWVKSFTGHRDTISALSFRVGSLQLFSASYDRTIKIFDLAAMGYVETLFGHQDVIADVSSLRSETAVSAGARDRTIRFWKVADESQLVFRGGAKSAIRELLEGGLLDDDDVRTGEQNEQGDAMVNGVKDHDMDGGHPGSSSTGLQNQKKRKKTQKFVEGSMECVAMIDETTFLSGGDSGSICLWSTTKKKPIFTHQLAHGIHETVSETEGIISLPRWVTSLAVLRYSDLFASGSWDGVVRLWQLDDKSKSFSALATLAAPGFVNSLQIIKPPTGALHDAKWIKPPDGDQFMTSAKANGASTSNKATSSTRLKPQGQVMIVAGLGQEPRLGRWMKISGEGTGSQNQTVVFVVPCTS